MNIYIYIYIHINIYIYTFYYQGGGGWKVAPPPPISPRLGLCSKPRVSVVAIQFFDQFARLVSYHINTAALHIWVDRQIVLSYKVL